jgi:tripartite-type tricarboxylate transporter receptor subunit TctC
VSESGLDYDIAIWWGLFAPHGLPAPILERMNAETNAALREPDLARLFQGEGARPSPETQAAFVAMLRSDIARWREVAQFANIRID